jgi:mannitol operon transcriptional antiterminator
MNEKNDFIKSIKKDYEKLFSIVKTALLDIFYLDYSDEEIAYVSLHFAATLERSDLVLPLKAALITSRGRVFSEFLISNLRVNFPALKEIDIIQTSEKWVPDFYDVIFTTEDSKDYVQVSRVLSTEKLDEIRHLLRTIQQNPKPRKFQEEPQDFMELNQLFTISNQLVESFTVISLTQPQNLPELVSEIEVFIPSSQADKISEILKKNFETTPFGLPDTNIALLHGVHASIEQPVFTIFDLNSEISLLAMDKSEIAVNRVLLLLAPEKVEKSTAYLLGKISSSIIENKLYTTIYKSGNAQVVQELLRQIMTDAIRKYGT